MIEGLASLLARLVLPLGAALVASLAGAVLGLAGRRRAAAALVTTAAVGLWLCATPGVSARVRAGLERYYPPSPMESTPPADAILVLGGGIGAAVLPRLEPDLADGADRVWHAARLYAAGRAPVVIVSGGIVPTHDVGVPEADSMASLLQAWGVPGEAIWREADSTDTRQNCARAAALLEAHGLRDVILVTSALHMPRALATCRSAGIPARPSSTDVRVVPAPPSWLDWLPDASALDGTSEGLHEWIGIVFYLARGWIDAGQLARALDAPAEPGAS